MARKSNIDSALFFMEHGVHLDTHTIWVGAVGNVDDEDDPDEITQQSVSRIIRGLHLLSSSDPVKEITIMMSTGGGDVDAGLALFDYIRNLSNPVHISVYGSAFSMGAALLQAGDRRSMSRHSALMIHDGFASAEGHSRDTRKNWLDFSRIQDKWYEQIILESLRAKDPEFSSKKLTHWLSKDTIFTADKCLELGLIDSISGKE